MADKLLLNIFYECSRFKIDLPWDNIAHRFHPGSSGSAIVQHLNRLRNYCLLEGHLVPPELTTKGGKPITIDPTMRGTIRWFKDDSTDVHTRSVPFTEETQDLKFMVAGAYDNVKMVEAIENMDASETGLPVLKSESPTPTASFKVKAGAKKVGSKKAGKASLKEHSPSPDPAELASDDDYNPGTKKATTSAARRSRRAKTRVVASTDEEDEETQNSETDISFGFETGLNGDGDHSEFSDKSDADGSSDSDVYVADGDDDSLDEYEEDEDENEEDDEDEEEETVPDAAKLTVTKPKVTKPKATKPKITTPKATTPKVPVLQHGSSHQAFAQDPMHTQGFLGLPDYGAVQETPMAKMQPALPSYGSDFSAYGLAGSSGHSLTPPSSSAPLWTPNSHHNSSPMPASSMCFQNGSGFVSICPAPSAPLSPYADRAGQQLETEGHLGNDGALDVGTNELFGVIKDEAFDDTKAEDDHCSNEFFEQFVHY